jgi:hypothetical protein
MLTKALEMSVSIGPRFGGTLRDTPFLGPLKEGKHFCILGHFYEEFDRYVKRHCKRELSP